MTSTSCVGWPCHPAIDVAGHPTRGMMICRLSGQSPDVGLEQSHIVPEFLYTALYGASHQIRSVNSELPYIRLLGKGVRERLLCRPCEMRIAEYESYFSRVWLSPDQGMPDEVPDGIGALERSGLDYCRFKLFHLSILWRASVATREEFLETKLGPHEDHIRELLLAGDPGSADEYRLGAAVLLRPNSSEVQKGLIAPPQPLRQGGRWIYLMIYGGCMWFCIMSRLVDPGMDVLTEDGKLRMPILSVDDVPNLRRAVARASTLRRGRK
jgi:hypothetical protein